MKIDTSTIAPSGAPVVLFRTCREELDVILAAVKQALIYTPNTDQTSPDIGRMKNIRRTLQEALAEGAFPGSRPLPPRTTKKTGKKRRKKAANERYILRLREMWDLIKDDATPEEAVSRITKLREIFVEAQNHKVAVIKDITSSPEQNHPPGPISQDHHQMHSETRP